jgi:hypothetical protein
MVNARISGLAVTAGVLIAACGGGGSTGTTSGGGTTTTMHTTATGTGGGTASMPIAPELNNIHAGAQAVLTWKLMTPCDTVEIERQDMVNPYPATPQFSVPGTMTTYTDTTATQSGDTYTYRARCVAGGVRSGWSNEVVWTHP